MDDYVLRIGKVLEEARLHSGYSQLALAKKMGINRETVFKWEHGLACPSAPMLIKWFECCGVAVKRYIDACLHPGLLEYLEDDLTDAEKRRILHETIDESSSYEVDLLLYLRYGDHGSDYLAVLCEVLANLHTPLKDRVAICRAITGHYEMAKATGTDPDPNGLQPNMEILYQAQDCGEAAAMKQNDAYTINRDNILR